jgi:Flp pilus assembly protein TadD
VSQVFHRAAAATIALLFCAHICAAQEQSAWSNFSDKVKNGFSSVTGSLTPKPHDTPADDPTALSSKSKVGPELHVAMARLCEVRKMPAEAAEHYRQALAEDPKYLPALIGFARLRVHTGELEEATKLYETAAKAFPKEASVFNDLGLCFAQRGMFEKATAAIDEAIRLQPTLVLYRNNIAMVLVDLGQIEMAYSHLAAVHPEAVAHYNLGYFLFKKGQSGEAVRQFTIAAQRDPSLVQAQQWLQRLQGPPTAVAAAPWQPAPPQPTPNTVEQPGREPDYRTVARPPIYGALPPQSPDGGSADASHAVVGPLDPDTERHKILRLPDVAADSADPPLPPEGSGGR